MRSIRSTGQSVDQISKSKENRTRFSILTLSILKIHNQATVRIFKSRWFAKFAVKESITDEMLCKAVKSAEQGLIDADYGGGVIKQRIARLNSGKSAGYRTIILFRQADKAIFVYGFSKKDRDNIGKAEERDFKDLAHEVFSQTEERLITLIETGAFLPVMCDE